MKKLLTVLLLIATPAMASISVRRSPYNAKKVDIYVVKEPLTDAIGALEMYLPKHVQLLLGEVPVITYRAREVAPETALRALVAAAKVQLTIDEDHYWVRSPGEPTVSIDFKDAEARVILKSMQRQCGIKNLMIDPQVQGTGTFLFWNVPCRQAFGVVLRTLGLSAETYSGNIVHVETAPH
jgi:hypothetical protein